jgi:hypothetical protein
MSKKNRRLSREEKLANKREFVAKAIALDDSILFDIISAHLGYMGSKLPITIVKNGIELYCVGRNASHEFYLGRKNGETWKYVVGESVEEDEDGYPKVECRMTKIEDIGYCGHL